MQLLEPQMPLFLFAKTAHTQSLDFGEILDPIDDLVERFSTL